MNDGLLLQINRQRNLIPEPLLKEALAVQEQERAAGKEPRPLLDILATREDLSTSTVRIIKSLKDRGDNDPLLDGNGNAEATVIDGFHAIVESVIQPPPGPAATTKTNWPKEVLESEADHKNNFGQFILVSQVGSGGSGTVYRAWDRRVGRYAGLKILHTMEPSALERFTREARIAGNLQHPSIATIYEVGEQDGRYYIAMKYIDGKPIDADPRSIPACLGLIRDACRALDYAHKQGVIHRDVKPANLLVDSQDRVYVTDFGIAKQALHDQTSTLSMTGTIIGTPKYLPPEQARGEAKHADARSDVYSIGATLYTLLAGRAPFPSSNVWETLESVMKREPPPLTSLNGAVSPELERIVAKAMSKEPANRFASAAELAEELDRILTQRRYTGRYGLLRYLARKWVAVAIIGIGLGALIHFNADFFFPESKPREFEPKDAYLTAAGRLMDLWDDYDSYKSTDRTNAVNVATQPIHKLLSRQPGHSQSIGLLARADFLIGNRATVVELKSKVSDDYRIRYIASLIDLEAYLEKIPPPLPSVEGPASEEWDGPIPSFPGGLTAGDFTVPAVQSNLLEVEARKDKIAAAGLEFFLKRDWKSAREKLFDYCKDKKPLPVFRRALHRATYLSRKWDVTQAQGSEMNCDPACRECTGAKLALALEKSNPIPDLETLRNQKLRTDDPLTDLLVLACIARRTVDRGVDPSAHFAAGEKTVVERKDEMSRRDELRGVLRTALLRWKAMTGANVDAEFAKIQEELTNKPATGMGRLSRIEALLALARVRKFNQGDFETPLDEALKLAEIADDAPWESARILKSEIYLRQGDLAKAYQEMPKATGNAGSDLRADLVLAEVQLRRGVQIPAVLDTAALEQGKVLAKAALNIVRDHPEALRIWGSITIELALANAVKDSVATGRDAKEAVDLLTAALNRVPNFLEVQFDRARALLIVADYASMSKSNATTFRLMAIKDLDSILERGKPTFVTDLRKHLWEQLTSSGTVTGLLK